MKKKNNHTHDDQYTTGIENVKRNFIHDNERFNKIRYLESILIQYQTLQ